jgi:hypothetical protein
VVQAKFVAGEAGELSNSQAGEAVDLPGRSHLLKVNCTGRSAIAAELLPTLILTKSFVCIFYL